VKCFRFIAAERASFPISLLCRVLGVSRSGFHAWEGRAPSDRALTDAWLTERIGEIHEKSRDSYGVRRIHLELREEGIRVGRKRIERLMRAAGLSGYVKRRKGKTTIRVSGVRVASDLVGRDFNPVAPNRLWASDIKYVSTWEGTLYLASVLDCFSRRVVGWSMRDDLQAELVVDALEMAISRRRPAGELVHHSDQGSQGGFNWSSQHLVTEVVRDGCWQASGGDSCDAWPDVVAGAAVGRAA
jgi:putative transposase